MYHMSSAWSYNIVLVLPLTQVGPVHAVDSTIFTMSEFASYTVCYRFICDTCTSADQFRYAGAGAGAGKKQQRLKAQTAPASPKKRKVSSHAELDEAPAAKKARQAPLGTAKRKLGRPRSNVQSPGHATSMPGGSGGLPADDVQHGGQPFLIVGRNDRTGVR